MNTQPNSILAKWLPSRGSVLFTLIVAAGLLYAQRAGAFPASPARTPSSSTNTLPYQGRLTDAKGAPLNGTYSMSFQLYNTATGGTPLWTEEWDFADSVVVEDGLFNVLLGSLTPIPQSVITGNSSLWLGISVATDSEMTPRVQVGSVPFAFQANRAYGLAAADGDPQDAVVVDANGIVGIGTTNPLPGMKLDIVGNTRINGQLGIGGLTDYFGLGTGDIGVINGGYLKSRNAADSGYVHLIGLNTGTNNIIIAQDGGNVGIGTTDPTNSLHVKRADGVAIAQFETSQVGGNATIMTTTPG